MKKYLLASATFLLASIALVVHAAGGYPTYVPAAPGSNYQLVSSSTTAYFAVPNVYYYAQAYGNCTWNSTHDVSPCIQAAINAASTTTTIANGGGTVVLPAGIFGIASTLSWSVPNVSLQGQGVGNVYGNNLTANASTILKWIGAASSTMLVVAPPPVSGNPISNDNVTGILFNCNGGLADVGFDEMSVSKSTFDIGYQQCGTNGVIFNVQSNMVKFGDTQQNDIWVQGYDDFPNSIGLLAEGTSTGGVNFGNTSENKFHLIHVNYKNGDGVHFDNTDHNVIDQFNGGLLPGGTGNAWIWNGSNNINNASARYNWMHNATYSGAMIARGLSSFSVASFYNHIDELGGAQNGTIPTVETGASLCYGGVDNGSVIGGCVGSSTAPLIAQPADNGLNGGNSRGANAVDLQLVRNIATQVASGLESTVIGGEQNTASGLNSTSLGGLGNTASGVVSTAIGSRAVADVYGASCSASGVVSSGRIMEVCTVELKTVSAANTSPVRLTADGLAAGNRNCVNNLVAGQIYNMSVQLSALDSSTPTNLYVWDQPIDLLAHPTGAASEIFVAGATTTVLSSGTTAGIAVTEAADTTNGCYDLEFTPPSGNTDIWHIGATVTYTRTD